MHSMAYYASDFMMIKFCRRNQYLNADYDQYANDGQD